MKTLATLSACKPLFVGAAAISIISGGAAIGLNAANSQHLEIAIESAKIESVIPTHKQTTISPSQEAITEEKTIEASSTVNETTKATSSASSQPKQQNNKTQTAQQTKPTQSTKVETKDTSWTTKPVQYKYASVYEFEEAFRGICPQDVPAGTWPDPLLPGVALGILHSAYGSKDPLAHADEIWSTMKGGVASISPNGIWLFGSDLFDSLVGSDGVDRWDHKLGFTIDWKTLTIDWRRINEEKNYKGKEGIGTDSDAYIKMETAAKQMTARIRQRNAEFKAKCGY